MRHVQIQNRQNGCTLGTRIGCAETFKTRLVGLLNRKEALSPEEGLWITPCSGIHTFGMRFSIDAIGLDKALRVVKLWPNVPPHRLRPVSLGVRSVLELRAGEIERQCVRLGDQLHAVSA